MPTRRRHFLLLAACLQGGILVGLPQCRAETADAIRINSLGYLPHATKHATIAAEATRFVVRDITSNEPALSGKLTPAGRQGGLLLADFSALHSAGRYQLEVEGVGASAPFQIAADLYEQPLKTCTRAMYLWRCGAAVECEHEGHVYRHDACHLDDGSLKHTRDGATGHKDGKGGWHDAGDYNKYVVNGAFAAGTMLAAWEHFAPTLKSVDLQVPESGDQTPDFLDEVRWEIAWLLKMQAGDGRVYHKLSTLEFNGYELPEEEAATRYFSPWGSAATADFVAITAQAARVYKPYDEAFAKECLEAARRSYAYLAAHPEDHQADQSDFHTGEYPTTDRDDRIWAAAELWATTGDASVLKDLQQRIRNAGVIQGPSPSLIESDWDWGELRNLGLFTYLLAERDGRDERLVHRLREDALASADQIAGLAERHAYGRTIGERYYWGSNGTVARVAMNLEVANRLAPDRRYRAAQLSALNYLLGRNPYGRSFVTSVGHRPPQNVHDRRSAGDDITTPWPGYLVGGPWPGPGDWQDELEDYKTNEVAINWNAALIYALAAAVDGDASAVRQDRSSPE